MASPRPLEPYDLTVRGVRVRYVDGGGDEGAVVLLHGLGRDHRQWGPLATALAERRRVVAIDLPGFGASGAIPLRTAPWEALAEATLDVVATLKLGRVAMIGHSMGAAVAIVAAADRPEFVERLVLIAPPCYRAHPQSLAERLLDVPLLGKSLFRRFFGPGVLRRYVGVGARDEAPREGEPPRTSNASTFAMFEASGSPSTIEARLPKVRAPALVVWGRDDDVSPWSHGTRLARELSGARLEILDCGHFPEAERPGPLSALVTEFLDDGLVREGDTRRPASRHGTVR